MAAADGFNNELAVAAFGHLTGKKLITPNQKQSDPHNHKYRNAKPLDIAEIVHAKHGGAEDNATYTCEFDKEYFHNFARLDSETDGEFTRGGQPYWRPCGWVRYGIKVLGKYDNGNNDWLGASAQLKRHDGVAGEWPVAYHGTCAGAAMDIIKYSFDAAYNRRQPHINGVHQTHLKGNYCTPHIEYAAEYAKEKSKIGNYFVADDGAKYEAVLQVRVRPQAYVIIHHDMGLQGARKRGPELCVQNGDLRPYGLCVRKLQEENEGEEEEQEADKQEDIGAKPALRPLDIKQKPKKGCCALM